MKILRTIMVAVAVLFLFLPAYALAEEPGAPDVGGPDAGAPDIGAPESGAPPDASQAQQGWMRISLIEGDVQIKTPEAADWGPASVNGPVSEGDQVWVPEGGKVELQLNNGSYIRLDQNSALQILSVDSDSSQFYLSQGHVYVYFDGEKGSLIQVDTPDASSRAFEKAIFRIDMSDEFTDVAVYKGSLDTENKVGTARVNAGEMVSLGQNTNGEVAPMGPSDDWESWNKTRNDALLAKRDTPGAQYLPPDIRTYAADLDTSGRWVDVPEYGHAWTPTVSAGVEWAPYRDGRWIWRGGQYVWVGYEPWGWAPYHYGRWAFVAGVGWCWVPPVVGAVYWAPGYVGWVRTGTYVAWVPLAPGEIYYGRGYYGPRSVNILSVNINQVRVTNVYKNVYVGNGVTVVSRNTFATARPQVVVVNKTVIQNNIFVRNNISIGQPAIRPTRASYFASAKTIPAAKQPPRSVRFVRVDQLKRSRPLMKEPDKSVLNPGVKPKNLPVNTVKTPRTPGKVRPTLQPVPGVEKERVRPPEGRPPRGEKPEMKRERRPGGPEGAPEGGPPGGEKPAMKKERRPGGPAPEGSPVPKGEKPGVKRERRPGGPEGAPEGGPPKGEKPGMKKERKPGGPEGTPEGGPAKGEKPGMKKERKPAGPEGTPEGGPGAKGDKVQKKPGEKKPSAPSGPEDGEKKKPQEQERF